MKHLVALVLLFAAPALAEPRLPSSFGLLPTPSSSGGGGGGGGGVGGTCGTANAVAYFSAATTLTCNAGLTTDGSGNLTLQDGDSTNEAYGFQSDATFGMHFGADTLYPGFNALHLNAGGANGDVDLDSYTVTNDRLEVHPGTNDGGQNLGITLLGIGVTTGGSGVAFGETSTVSFKFVGADVLYGDATSHRLKLSNNNATYSDVMTRADTFTSSANGVAPSSGGGTTNFLRADGSWAAPTGTGPGGSCALTNGAAYFSSATTIGCFAMQINNSDYGAQGQLYWPGVQNYSFGITSGGLGSLFQGNLVWAISGFDFVLNDSFHTRLHLSRSTSWNASTGGLIFPANGAGLIYSTADTTMNLIYRTTDRRLSMSSSATTINSSMIDSDFVVATTGNASELHVDAGGDCVGIGTATCASATQVLNVAGNVTPSADNTDTLGSALLRWSDVFAVNVTMGDLVMRSPGDNGATASWRLIERAGGIEAVNENTGERFWLVMERE